MILNLHVKNMALIEEADIDLSPGLTILTGETGAGKSIMIGSIVAGLGGKTSSDVIRKGCEYALVELTFQVSDRRFLKQLQKMDIEDLEEGILIISRKIMPGRSVFKVNGTTLTASAVKELAAQLMDIHGQHEHQSLLRESNHLKLVDRFLSDEGCALKEQISEEYAKYAQLLDKQKEFDIDEERRLREISFLTYETEEISSAHLLKDEDTQLEKDFRKMENAQKIADELSTVNNLLFEGTDNAAELTGRAVRALKNLSGIDVELDGLMEELDQIDMLFSEFSRNLSTYMGGLDFDREQYAQTEQRLDKINSLKMKYGQRIEEILEYLENSKQKLADYENFDQMKTETQQQVQQAEKRLLALCSRLTKERKEAGNYLADKIRTSLQQLNFLDARFAVEFRGRSMSPGGADEAAFLIATNPGEDLKPLSKIASGGEMSRIMLAIKEAIAQKDEIDSLIFDEIDTGISGKTAQMVAEKMHAIARTHQVLCITHLPQIAAMADHHLLIEKTVAGDKTQTTITPLTEEDSIRELARLLGGSKITKTVLANAREMKEAVQQG